MLERIMRQWLGRKKCLMDEQCLLWVRRGPGSMCATYVPSLGDIFPDTVHLILLLESRGQGLMLKEQESRPWWRNVTQSNHFRDEHQFRGQVIMALTLGSCFHINIPGDPSWDWSHFNEGEKRPDWDFLTMRRKSKEKEVEIPYGLLHGDDAIKCNRQPLVRSEH